MNCDYFYIVIHRTGNFWLQIQRMALFDNRMWILSHIHNSFVSSDDTGVCEMVLSPETFREDMTHVAKANVSNLQCNCHWIE